MRWRVLNLNQIPQLKYEPMFTNCWGENKISLRIEIFLLNERDLNKFTLFMTRNKDDKVIAAY